MLNRVHTFGTNDIPSGENLDAELNNIHDKLNGNITAGDLAADALPTNPQYVDASEYATLQEAIDAAQTAGKHVYMPSGTYDNDTTPPIVPDGVHLIGAGQELVTVKPPENSSRQYVLVIGGGSAECENIVLRGFTISEPTAFGATPTRFVGIGFIPQASASYTNNVIIEDVDFDLDSDTYKPTSAAGMKRIGIALNEAAQYDMNGMTIRRCRFFLSAGYAYSTDIEQVGIKGSNNQQRIEVSDCYFNDGHSHVEMLNTIDDAQKGVLIVRNCQFVNGPYAGQNIFCRPNGIIEGNAFFQYDGGVETGAHIYIWTASASKRATIIRGNTFTTTNAGDGFVPIKVAHARIYAVYNTCNDDGSGYYDYFINFTQTPTYYSWVRFNKLNASTVLFADQTKYQEEAVFGKTYDAFDIMRMGDIYMWLYHTGTTNYLGFKEGSVPANATDADCFIALSGMTTDITN